MQGISKNRELLYETASSKSARFMVNSIFSDLPHLPMWVKSALHFFVLSSSPKCFFKSEQRFGFASGFLIFFAVIPAL